MPKRKSDPDLSPDKALLALELERLRAWESLVPPADAKVILAYDPGLVNLGICVLETGRGQFVATTSKIDLPKLETIGARVAYIMAVIEVWIVAHKPDLMVKEGPSFSTHGACDSGRVQFALELAAYKFGIPLITVAPMSLRKFLGTSGKQCTKSDNKLQVFKRWGLEMSSEDETEAFGLAVCGQEIAQGKYIVAKKVKNPRKSKKAV